MTLRAETLTYWYLRARGDAADGDALSAARQAGLAGPRVTDRRAHKGGGREIEVTGYLRYDGSPARYRTLSR